jgi:hypothetical protein
MAGKSPHLSNRRLFPADFAFVCKNNPKAGSGDLIQPLSSLLQTL